MCSLSNLKSSASENEVISQEQVFLRQERHDDEFNNFTQSVLTLEYAAHLYVIVMPYNCTFSINPLWKWEEWPLSMMCRTDDFWEQKLLERELVLKSVTKHKSNWACFMCLENITWYMKSVQNFMCLHSKTWTHEIYFRVSCDLRRTESTWIISN